MPDDVPPMPPGYCDPWYAGDDNAWVRQWINNKDGGPCVRLSYIDENSGDLASVVLERRKAIAPDVAANGDPVTRVWWVAIDNHGRSVCSESWIVHDDPWYRAQRGLL